MHPGEQVGLAAQGGRVEETGGQRTAHTGGSGGGVGEEAPEGGEQQAFVGEPLGAERADESEHVVDPQVVGEALVGDLVGDEGVAALADTRQSGFEVRAAGLAEVVALVVAVAAAHGPAVGVQQEERVLLVRLQGDARLTVEPQDGPDDLLQIPQEPLGGDRPGPADRSVRRGA